MRPQPLTSWYLFASNGTNGFLLDLVQRPFESLARLVTYRQGYPPHIMRRGYASRAINGKAGALGVSLDGISLDALGCRSALPGCHLDVHFALGPVMHFSPPYVTWTFDNAPDFRSQYGIIQSAVCEGAVYDGWPVTCSTYSLDDYAGARWILLSAPRFAGTDLAIELSALHLLGRWMPSARVFYQGREYRLNSALDCLFRLQVERAGDVASGERVFAVSIRATNLRMDIEARGSLAQFARLDSDLESEVHTTLFGTCRATVASTGQRFVAERTCLLEVKN